jgi:hypothetical protein
MDIKEKLMYIQEGYTFNDIISDNFNPIKLIKEMDELFIDSFTNDIQYITEMTIDTHSKSTFIDHVKRILKWLRDKVMQFINFIKQKFFSIRKGSKETVKNVKASAEKARHIKSIENKRVGHKPEDHHEPDYDQEFQHDDGALEYRPEDNEITLFSKTITHDDFFEAGFKKVYNVISKYIDQLEKNPENHANIIADSELNDTNPFLNKVFKEALSVNYDKNEIFKKIYGDPITKTITVNELTDLADRLQKLDDECQVFADWIQKTLPESLDKIEVNFMKHIRFTNDKVISGISDNIDADKKLIDELNHSLTKIIKLVNIEISVIQFFAYRHAQVFIHMRNEMEHYDWVLNPTSYDYDYDNGGLIH